MDRIENFPINFFLGEMTPFGFKSVQKTFLFMEKVGSKFENHCFKEQVRLLGFVLNLLQSCFLFPFLFFFPDLFS